MGERVTDHRLADDYIGLGLDDDDHLVMECYDAETETLVKGSFLECTENGYTTDC